MYGNATFPSMVDANSLTGPTGFTIQGANAGSFFPRAMATGDVGFASCARILLWYESGVG